MRFVDLFAGLGGFNLALSGLGHECVFASEIQLALRDIYRINFGIYPDGDVRNIETQEIPHHDILCAGFPCQSFSKAGAQLGLGDPHSGGLFDEIVRIVQHHRPKYLILENVPNIVEHAAGDTWQHMKCRIQSMGYQVDERPLSPHQFEIPQHRVRVFIVASAVGLDHFSWPDPIDRPISLETILDKFPDNAKQIDDRLAACLDVWQQFLDKFPKDSALPSFPIWSAEFGADYPYEETTPYSMETSQLRQYKGSHGRILSEEKDHDLLASVPSYAREKSAQFPKWKQAFIRSNRTLFADNESWLIKWREKIVEFPPSWQKFEWNAKGEPRDLWQLVLQVRASGIRVKRRSTAPSLVAMTTTQVPIVGWERRYMTVNECARLQSMDGITLPATRTAAFAALGNAVNVHIAQLVACRLCVPDVG